MEPFISISVTNRANIRIKSDITETEFSKYCRILFLQLLYSLITNIHILVDLVWVSKRNLITAIAIFSYVTFFVKISSVCICVKRYFYSKDKLELEYTSIPAVNHK